MVTRMEFRGAFYHSFKVETQEGWWWGEALSGLGAQGAWVDDGVISVL